MNIFYIQQQVKVYKGVGWSSDFSPTHFDRFSPPDFYTKVSTQLYSSSPHI